MSNNDLRGQNPTASRPDRIAQCITGPSTRATAIVEEATVDSRDCWGWLGAFTLFGVGDMLTTASGLALGAVESNPVALTAIDAIGLWPAMVLTKATVLGVVGLLWAAAPQLYRAAAPISLAVWGSVVVANNSLIVVLGVTA